jgi:adenylate cyclase
MSLGEAEQALAAGNLVQAYTAVRKAADAGAASSRRNYLEVLAVARMGDTSHAQQLYERYGLGLEADPDSLSLKARLLKDQALAGPEDARARALEQAAAAYSAAYEATGDLFPLVNAATLTAAAGNRDLSHALAQNVLLQVELSEHDGYWQAVSRAEALLVLGRREEAEQALRGAANQPDASRGARSSTIRQFERLLPLIGSDEEDVASILSILRPSPVVHFCGHLFAEGAEAEGRLTGQIDEALAKLRTEIGYGALAAGSDILIAERLLARGAELHVVLPFALEDFLKVSVKPAGSSWLGRFERCCSRATSIVVASNMPYVCDPRQFRYGSEVAMGMAELRSAHLATDAVQIAVWDGRRTDHVAGTYVDISNWKKAGKNTIVIDFPGVRVPVRDSLYCPDDGAAVARGSHAILFSDFSGFSGIGEENLPVFWDQVMGRSAEIINTLGKSILCRNTWGDALYLVIDDVVEAANLALSLQEEMLALDLNRLETKNPGMRIALHYGTMYRAPDPVTGFQNFFGSEVSRAARLEPVTPRHSVYVTEPFAAVLALKPGRPFDMHYVGEVALAKEYGRQPVYRLARGGRIHHAMSFQTRKSSTPDQRAVSRGSIPPQLA